MTTQDGADRVTDPKDESETPINRLDRSEFRRLLMGLTPEEFEHFVADIWNELRPGTPEVTELRGDMGVDVAITDGLEREMIQVKRYHIDNPVGRPDVQQYYALYDQEDADRVTIVTSGQFTDEAISWAEARGVTLFDADDLFDLFQAADLSYLLSAYFLEGDYELHDRSMFFARLQRLGRPVLGLPGLVLRFSRPVWAGVVAATAALMILVSVLVFGVQLATDLGLQLVSESASSGSQPVTGGAAVAMGLTIVIWILVFPISLGYHGKRRRALVSIVFTVAAFAVLGGTATIGQILTSVILLVLFGGVFAIAGEDLLDVSRTGLATHVSQSLDPYLSYIGVGNDEDGEGTQQGTTVNPPEFATVAGRQRD